MKKIAVLIYPYFSMQEISCLTDALYVWFERETDVFASSKEIIRSEDGFQLIANKTLDEFDIEQYSAVVLPGILNPIPALHDEKLIEFLKGLKGKEILIAAICAGPILLAKAGLLNDVKFTCSIWQEICERMDFIPHQNLVKTPVLKDKNFITAEGFAFREFAQEVLEALMPGSCEGGIYKGVYREYKPEELTQYMGEESFKEFLDEYNSYLKV